MARLIFKAPYYKPGRKAGKGERGAYAKYIATRDGVELLRSGMADYINELEESETKKLLSKINLLLDNTLACKIMGTEYLESSTPTSSATEFPQFSNTLCPIVVPMVSDAITIFLAERQS